MSLLFVVFVVIGDHESNNAEAVENDNQEEYQKEFKKPDRSEHESDSRDDDDTREAYESYEQWNNPCGQYETGKEDECYAYPSCSTYDSQYEEVPTYESPSGYTSCSRYTKRNGAYHKCGSSSEYESANPYESSTHYESQYDCEYSPTYETQYSYEYHPSQQSEYEYQSSAGYQPSSGYQSQYQYDYSRPYEWKCGYRTCSIYDVQHGFKNSPVYESPYEYDSGYEWISGQNEPQSRYVSRQENELSTGWKKMEKDCKTYAGSNEHDMQEPSSGGLDEAQGLKFPVGYPPAQVNKLSVGPNETVVTCIRAMAGSPTVTLPSDEPINNQQNQLPNGIRKQLLYGSDGFLGGMKKFLDGTKKLLRRGNQLPKELITVGPVCSGGQLPSINSPPLKGIRQQQGRGNHLQYGNSVIVDHSRGARWPRGGMTPHLPEISSKLLDRVNRFPGRCNFLSSHSGGSFNT